MSNVIDLADRMKRPPLRFGATVAIEPQEPGSPIVASVTSFWGDDGMEVWERCEAWANALQRLTDLLHETAKNTKP